MADTKKLGAELGAHFAQVRALGSKAEQEAKTLVDAILAGDPKIKLPHILADERVQSWQQQTGVSNGHLKDALTKARADLKSKPERDAINIPPRTRHRIKPATSEQTEPQVEVLASTLPGIVPNLPLDRL